MTEATRYYVRTKSGQKGPYTLEQMKASIEKRLLSADAQYRTGEEEEWQPLEHLKKQLAREASRELTDRLERAPELALPEDAKGRSGMRSARDFLIIVVVLSLCAAGLLWERSRHREVLGKPCRVPQDCTEKTTCLMLVDPDRRIQAEGYCTRPCSGPGDCGGAMYCGDALSVRPQGGTWDGMFDRNTRVCLKR